MMVFPTQKEFQLLDCSYKQNLDFGGLFCRVTGGGGVDGAGGGQSYN